MNPKERFLAALRGEPLAAAPGWMMRQAGRYLPEYQELRTGRTFMERVRDPHLAAEITLQPVRRFGMDAAVIFCDILVPPDAMGVKVEFIDGKGPVMAEPLRSAADIERLVDFDPRQATGYLAEAIGLVRTELGDSRAIVGFCGAPFTTASYMIEGGSSRNFERTKALLYDEPETFARLLDRVVDNLIPYLAMQVEAGADALQIFDSWGGALDAHTYREVLSPSLHRLVEGARATGVPVIVYANGASHLLEVLADTGCDCLSIDWRTDPAEARARVGGRVSLQGNLDPCVLFSSPDVVRRETNRVLDAFAGHAGHVFNVGSGILPKTPVECVGAAFETLFERR
ncbi:uroporphyrinogen decarboxylase [Engelhardtia mirabilis]|uniref:Uroporphyrinogen decarboxylase n=1 Tax=Engelhardtia mirabilis TaxID=2528011 RepID=A0A518BSU7_9BACT|nr:Uroporphyrinogen decarboxylase [Planctomycetes bacterium Pla133]QDV04367.1 Uroporphyrinogen decarboxylase [Planctomycetes bacterium Pla86]